MDRKAVSGIVLTLLLTSMLTLAFNIHLVRAESTDRKVGVSVGYWIQYGISVMWESNDPNATTPQYVLDSQQLVFFSNVVQSVSGTNVTFNRIMLFKNGTEKSETRWIDVDTGRGSGYLFLIAANLSAGDIIYTGLGKGIGEINETITRTYLGEPVEINHSNGTTSNSYFIYSDTYWNKATGVLYESYINHTKYTTKGEETYVTQETQWLYPIGIIGVAKTWTVDDDGPADFSTIHGAVSSASPGDTIYVKAGTYREPQVTINKPLRLIGENKNTTIVDGGGTWVCLYVQNTQNVTISGFTVQNGSLYSWGSQNITINGNIIVDSEQGIVIGDSAYITVSKNIVTRNGAMPIHLGGSKNIKICENIVTLNDEDSIWLSHSSNNSIYWNEITSNGRGIRLDWSLNNRIYGNNITNNGVGIWYWASSNNSVYGNKIEDNVSGIVLKGYPGNLSSFNTIFENNIENNDNGVWLEMSLNNSIYRNNITNNNQDGIRLDYSSNNSIYENNITSNGWYDRYGILLSECSNNIIYHNNFVNNTHQVETYNSVNLWDYGYPSGGNLWSDYAGEDRNGDGIGDTPYVIDENNIDNYPLMGLLILNKEAIPLWMQWSFWTIVAAGIVVLAVAVYFLRKRKSLRPITSTFPLEDTDVTRATDK